MLIKNIIIENVGPIKRINIELPINEDNTPQPIIIVGENGKGKSTLISSIVDSLFEYSKQAFNDVVPKSFENQNPYFKISSYINTTVGEKYSFSFINFINDYQYIDKSGEISFEECKEKTKGILTLNSNWDNIGNVKNCTRDKSYFEDEFVKKAICYFPPNRYEKPIWMNEDALFKGIFNIEGKINGKLNKPILIENVNKANINWLLDIIADSRVDVCEEDGKLIAQQNPLTVMLLNKARKNVEEILSQILDKEVKFGLNWRNSGASRFNIMDKDNNMVIPSLEALSTGETALFNIFSTIIRYADYSDINRSINLNEIEGLVIIDEIDLHLHSKIQANILPKLLKKFPKVQFIVTTHSPLFVLGMEETYGKDNYVIYNMPDGNIIEAEEFSEFKASYNMYKQSKIFSMDINNLIKESVGKTLVITEGKTDWKHLKHALAILKRNDKFNNLDFSFLEYDDKVEMGGDNLVSLCRECSKISRQTKIIAIFDRDDSNTINKISKNSEIKEGYYDWGNGVYSIILPIPQHRITTPNICIEHYYSDIDIKLIDENGRRIYMGNEFSQKSGLNIDDKKTFCNKKNICGANSIHIIDNGIYGVDDEEKNIALSKNDYAEYILNEIEPFNGVDVSAFEIVFSIIEKIEQLV